MSDTLTYKGSSVLLGGGGETQAFLNSVGTGTLAVDEGRLQINASVDARGTFNHNEFSSNYFKTLSDGTKFTTTVAADSVTMTSRKDGVDTPVMKLNSAGLELNSKRVLDERFAEMMLTNTFIAPTILNKAGFTAMYPFIVTQAGDYAVLNMPSYQPTGAFGTENDPFRGMPTGQEVCVGNNSSAKHIYFSFTGSGNQIFQPIGNAPDRTMIVRMVGVGTVMVFNPPAGTVRFKKIVFDAPAYTGGWTLVSFGIRYSQVVYSGDIYVNATGVNTSLANDYIMLGQMNETSGVNVYLAMPAMTKPFQFFVASTTDDRILTRKNKVAEVVYLLDHLGTPTALTSFSSGIDAAAGEVKDVEETIGGSTFAAGAWRPTDAELVAALQRHPKWNVGFYPVA